MRFDPVTAEGSGGKRDSPMRITSANTLSGFACKSAESVSDFASVVRNLILDIRDSYRPEVHYMRGPGPKWHACDGASLPIVCFPARGIEPTEKNSSTTH